MEPTPFSSDRRGYWEHELREAKKQLAWLESPGCTSTSRTAQGGVERDLKPEAIARVKAAIRVYEDRIARLDAKAVD